MGSPVVWRAVAAVEAADRTAERPARKARPRKARPVARNERRRWAALTAQRERGPDVDTRCRARRPLDTIARGCRAQHFAPLEAPGKWDELEVTVQEHWRREAAHSLSGLTIVAP